MKAELADKFRDITMDLSTLIDELKPTNPDEWEAKEALTSAHKGLRKIDVEALKDKPARAPLSR